MEAEAVLQEADSTEVHTAVLPAADTTSHMHISTVRRDTVT